MRYKDRQAAITIAAYERRAERHAERAERLRRSDTRMHRRRGRPLEIAQQRRPVFVYSDPPGGFGCVGEPGDSEAIHSPEVLDLLPVIEDQTFDPIFDGFGSLEIEHLPPGLRAMHAANVSRADTRLRASPAM